jgi:uncharacterized RDD family membrane protein YckC
MACAICAGVCRCGRANAPSPSSSLALGKSLLTPTDNPSEVEGGEWRREVAIRVTRYRARRGRYGTPSLSLNFDVAVPAEFATQPEDSNLIEFPRTVAPIEIPQELVVPVVSPPRILEAPESPQGLLPSAPQAAEFQYGEAPDMANDAQLNDAAEELPLAAFGAADDAIAPMAYAGMILEEILPLEEKTFPEPSGMDVSVSFASPSLRGLAGLVDSAMVLAGVALFILLLDKMNSLPLGSLGLVVAAGVFIFLWTLYQYLFLVYRGSTAGLGVAKLNLATMQGTAAPRSARRTRALCMLLSCASLGLGFAWAFLDEDGLCWHDRISRTCLIIANSEEQVFD